STNFGKQSLVSIVSQLKEVPEYLGGSESKGGEDDKASGLLAMDVRHLRPGLLRGQSAGDAQLL
ncbi:MAG: hypothetical protein ABII13_04990, partial [Patescibacteria group bacterium]